MKMAEEDPILNGTENTKKRRISSILKSRIGDGDTTTYVGVPAVVPVLEKKGRRVSFADADDIRLFKAAVSDIDPAQNVASEYSMVKRGVLTDRTDLMQSNVVAKTNQPVAGAGQRLIGSTQHQSNDASDVRTTMFSTNIKMFMPTPHEASEDLDRSRIFMGEDSDREDSDDGSQVAAAFEDEAMIGNRTRIGCEGMDLTAVFEIGNVTRTAPGNRTVIGSCDMEMTRVCNREELELQDDGSDMNRTRILGDTMEVSVCTAGTKSFLEDDCKSDEKSVAGQPQLKQCQTGFQNSSSLKVHVDRTVIVPEEMNLTECLPVDFQLNATATLKDLAKDSGSQACEQLDITKVFSSHDACLEETRCFDNTIHLNAFMQDTNLRKYDMDLTQCRAGWDAMATMVFDQSATMNETTAQSGLAVSERSSANLVDAKAFLSMLDCPPSSSLSSSSKTDAKSFISMLTTNQSKTSVETKKQRNDEAIAIDKDLEVNCLGGLSAVGVQRTVCTASASSITTGSAAPEIVTPANTSVQENLASGAEASIVQKKLEGSNATCRKPVIKADKRMPNVDDMLKSLHVSHAKKPRISTNSEPVTCLGDIATNVDCQNDMEFAASVPDCQTDYTESGFPNWKENTLSQTAELKRGIGSKSCTKVDTAAFSGQEDPVINFSLIAPASDKSYHSVLVSMKDTTIIGCSELAEQTEQNVTALLTELPVLSNLSTFLDGTVEENVAGGLGCVVGSTAKVGLHDHEPTVIFEDDRGIRTDDNESMVCSQTAMAKAISGEKMKPEEAFSVCGNVSMPSVSMLEADISGPLSISTAEAVFATFQTGAVDSPPKPNWSSDGSVSCDRSAILNRTAAKSEVTSSQFSKRHEDASTTHTASFDLTHVTVDGRASMTSNVNTTRAQNSFLSGSFSGHVGASDIHQSVCSAAVSAASASSNLERSCNSLNRTVTKGVGNMDYSLNKSVETAAATTAVTNTESASSFMGYVDGPSLTRANATAIEGGQKSLRKSSIASSLADESFPEVELSTCESSSVKYFGGVSSDIQGEPFAGDVSQPSFDYEDFAKKLSSLEKFFDDLDVKLQSEMDAMMLQQMEKKRIDAERQELANKLSTATQLLGKLEHEREQVIEETTQFLKLKRDAESRFSQRQTELAIMSKKLSDEEMWLKRLVAWTMIEWDWETGCRFSFLDDTLLLVVKFGDVVEGKHFLSRPVRTIQDLNLDTVKSDNAAWTPLLTLAHQLLFESVSVDSMRQKFKLTTDLPEILRSVSSAVVVAKHMTDDLNRLDYYTDGENVKIDGNKISVLFVNVRAFTKFRLSCEIHMSSFLTSAPSWTFTNIIGNVSETDVMNVVGNVVPGTNYFHNLQKAMQQYFRTCKRHTFQ